MAHCTQGFDCNVSVQTNTAAHPGYGGGTGTSFRAAPRWVLEGTMSLEGGGRALGSSCFRACTTVGAGGDDEPGRGWESFGVIMHWDKPFH